MPYKAIQANLQQWPNVERFIRGTLEPLFFHDVHTMLRLPLREQGLTAGCNFAITHMLLASVSGISTTLFNPTPDASGASGKLFMQCLTKFYPWDVEKGLPNKLDDLADSLYNEFRNPLAHNLGILRHVRERIKKSNSRKQRPSPSKKFEIERMNKEGLDETTIEKLESSDEWPFLPTFKFTVEVRPDAEILKVERLYWGIRQMVRRLAKNQETMKEAENFHASLRP